MLRGESLYTLFGRDLTIVTNTSRISQESRCPDLYRSFLSSFIYIFQGFCGRYLLFAVFLIAIKS